jgi:hypothetical protein
MKKTLATLVTLGALISSAHATVFTCKGKAMNESGAWSDSEITLKLDGDSAQVIEDDNLQLGFGMDAQYDEAYRPTAKYKGYSRFNVRSPNAAGWNDVLVLDSMKEKGAKTGKAVLQGTEEDGGMAAYFDDCTKTR